MFLDVKLSVVPVDVVGSSMILPPHQKDKTMSSLPKMVAISKKLAEPFLSTFVCPFAFQKTRRTTCRNTCEEKLNIFDQCLLGCWVVPASQDAIVTTRISFHDLGVFLDP